MVGTDSQINEYFDKHGKRVKLGDMVMIPTYGRINTGKIVGYKDGITIYVNNSWFQTLNQFEFKECIIINENIEWLFKR